ncbi:hypothetical protein D0469_18210 [Peribacillus saganii]|uniref:Putative zinc ribbon domain-containing protein n=1 Tax=Peribacillus saganii TaxID=2303992 RepID=A0A372LE17_9BACI|nr:zinc ribbon domain-containing protein [Peribacillus saganii]RFU64494.1 hypothetical protein D0469_18210 [Peribacillus saganii]
MTLFKNCQSCGMPLAKDKNGGRTEHNGQKSGMYRSHCYENGEFVQPAISAAEMKLLVENKIRESGFPKIMAKLFTRNIHKLERWQEHQQR